MGLKNNKNLARSAKLHPCTVPNDVKGKILEDWYKVSLKEFWEALQNKSM